MLFNSSLVSSLRSSWLRPSSLVLLALGAQLTACGPMPTLVQQIQIETQGSGVNSQITMSTLMNLNGFQMGTFELPIWNPQTGKVYGTLKTSPSNNSTTQISLGVNVGELVQDPSIFQAPVLPNGSAVPIQTQGQSIWMLNAGDLSKIYLGVLPNQIVIGFAITIPEFDGLSRNIPIPLNLFPVIPLQADLNIAAGMFTSKNAASSGIAVFADYKKGLVIDIPQAQPQPLAPSQTLTLSKTASALRVADTTAISAPMELKSIDAKDSYQQELGKQLQKLRSKKRKLSIL